MKPMARWLLLFALALIVAMPASAAAISSVVPPIGGANREVVLHGEGFTGTTQVNFTLLPAFPFQTPATFTVDSDTTMRVQIPDCGGRAGIAAISVVGSSGATISMSPDIIKTVASPVTGNGETFGNLLLATSAGSLTNIGGFNVIFLENGSSASGNFGHNIYYVANGGSVNLAGETYSKV